MAQMYKEGQIVELEGTKYLVINQETLAEIAYFEEDGKPVLKTQTITRDEGFDAEGNPKRSVEIRVQCRKVGAIPGKN
jgi:hypothetical protein